MGSDTSRHAILAGLAAAPVAEALPGADPVLAALAEHDRLGLALDAANAHTIKLAGKYDAMLREIGLVSFLGEEVPTLAYLEVLAERAKVGATPEIDAEYLAARTALIEREPAYHAAYVASGLKEAEAAEDGPYRALCDAEIAVVMSKPASPAGAVALLRFIADNFDDLIDDSREAAPDAIRAAVAVLEREAQA